MPLLTANLQSKPSNGISNKSYQFVLWADSPMPNTLGYHKKHFEALVAQLAKLKNEPDFIMFTGDHVWGYNAATPDALKDQWKSWFESYKPIDRNSLFTVSRTPA